MKWLVFSAYFLLGVGRNLPYEGIYYYGLGIADVAFLFLLVLVLTSHYARRDWVSVALAARFPLSAVALMALFAFVSLVFNSFLYGVRGKDAFEIMKYGYLACIFVTTMFFCRRTVAAVVSGFVAGVLVSAVVAILNPMNPDVLGTPQMFNPNVIGNALAAAVAMCSFLILAGRPLLGGALASGAAILSFFTFSKGAWLMSALGLLACYLAIASTNATRGRFELVRIGAYAVLVFVLAILYQYWDLVSLVVQAKIFATDFEASAAEGGSFSARIGLIFSAILMFLSNPLLGVGISNFESVNATLSDTLGNSYYDDDNPNSAWFYVLACMGLPAFVCFGLLFWWFLRSVASAPAIQGRRRVAYVLLVGLAYFIGGNVQVEMLTAYYYWVALGVAAAWRPVTDLVHSQIEVSRTTYSAAGR